MELMCELASSETRFSELDEKLYISHTTLTKRLGEAEDIGLIETRQVKGDRRRTHEYSPTDRAVLFMRKLKLQGVLERYQLYKESRIRFEEEADKIVEWAEENPDKIPESDEESHSERINRLSPFEPEDPEFFDE